MSYLGSRGQRPLYRRAWNLATANIRFFSRRQFGDNTSCSFVRCAKQKLIPAVGPTSDMHDSCNLFSVLSLPYLVRYESHVSKNRLLENQWPILLSGNLLRPAAARSLIEIFIYFRHITPATFLMWGGMFFVFWGQVCWSKAHYAVGFLTSALHVYIPKTELVNKCYFTSTSYR